MTRGTYMSHRDNSLCMAERGPGITRKIGHAPLFLRKVLRDRARRSASKVEGGERLTFLVIRQQPC